MLLEKVRKTVSSHGLLKNGDKVLCAVSGGADSVCLLHVMLRLRDEYNLTLYVAHINHMIRGEEANSDAEFVKAISRAADIRCFYREYNIPLLSKELKMGEEECGRVKRYEFFDEISKELGSVKIATAHNLNDNAETILFRLARGVSAEGISGIKVKRKNIIRPLIDVTRSEIEEYLKAYSITWREDSSNLSTEYSRNKIRLNVLPKLCEMFEGAERKIVNAAKLISEDNAFLNRLTDKLIEDSFKGDYLDAKALLKAELPILRRAAGRILKKWNTKEITAAKIERFIGFLSAESGAEFDINAGNYAKKSYDSIHLLKRNPEKGFFYVMGKADLIDTPEWKIQSEVTDGYIKKNGNSIAVFDADLIDEKIIVRSRKDGDRICQKGLGGTKKISDIFSDEKVPLNMRDEIPLVLSGNEIIYVCGLRQSEYFKINEKTKNYLTIRFLQKE